MFRKKEFTVKSWKRTINICKKLMKYNCESAWQREFIDFEIEIPRDTATAFRVFNWLGENLPKSKKAEIPEKRYNRYITYKR
jgi:hypothetical protein